MKVIAVCGSLRFIKEMMDITEKMELQGNCMLVPIYNSNKPNKDAYSEKEALTLDNMHKDRIKLSDAILVVNVNNYIGSSTKNEIEFAKSLNKEIIYYTDLVKWQNKIYRRSFMIIITKTKKNKEYIIPEIPNYPHRRMKAAG